MLYKNEKKCYLNDNICIKSSIPKLELKPTGINIMITILILFLGYYGILTILYQFGIISSMDIKIRFSSLSFCSGIIGILALLYNKKELKILFLSLSPLLFILFPLQYYMEKHNLIRYTDFNWSVAIISHILHFIFFFLFIREKMDMNHIDFIFAAIFWIFYLSVVFIFFSPYQFSGLSFLPSLFLVSIGCFISWSIVYILNIKKKKKRLNYYF